MSHSQPCTTTVAIAHNGYGLVTLTVGVRIVAEFFGDRKVPYVRRPFREYSFESALGTRSGSRKVTGEHVVGFATDLGVSHEEARRVVNEALVYLGWPEVTGEDHPLGGIQVTIVALIAEGWVGKAYPPGIYRVLHDPEADPVAAIKAAAREFVHTPDGREYLQTNVGGDRFNWGDAVVAIPPEILARHGVQTVVVEDVGAHVVIVDHDEGIAEPDP
jgi:hypothetical protein